MPTSPCPDCAREIAEGALACPHCGSRNTKARAANADAFKWGCVVGLVLIVLWFLLVALGAD